jgi:hypothetical protein
MGITWQGAAGLGKAWRGEARLGKSRQGYIFNYHLTGRGLEGHGGARLGLAGQGKAGHFIESTPILRRSNMSGYWYLAGPMRGIAAFNFPAFAAAAADLRRRGLTIVSPAEVDEEHDGFYPVGMEGTDAEVADAGLDPAALILRDVHLICNDDCLGVIVLPKWQASKGVAVEKATADFLRKPFLQYPQEVPSCPS